MEPPKPFFFLSLGQSVEEADLHFLVLSWSLSSNVWLSCQSGPQPSRTSPPSLLTCLPLHFLSFLPPTDSHTHTHIAFYQLDDFIVFSIHIPRWSQNYPCGFDRFFIAASIDTARSSALAQALHLLLAQEVTLNRWIFHCFL